MSDLVSIPDRCTTVWTAVPSGLTTREAQSILVEKPGESFFKFATQGITDFLSFLAFRYAVEIETVNKQYKAEPFQFIEPT